MVLDVLNMLYLIHQVLIIIMQKLFILYIALLSITLVVSQSTIQAVSYVIGQNAFRDAPDRYANFVQQAVTDANNYPLQDDIVVYSCRTSYWIYGSRSTKQFTIVPGSLQVNIVSDGIVVNANINTYIDVPVKIQWRKKILGICISHTICDRNAVLTGNFQLSIKFTATWQQGITITAVPTLNGDNFNIQYCTPPSWMNIFVNVQQVINEKVQEQIDQLIATLVQQFNVPTIFSPVNGIYFIYQITGVQFSADDRIIITTSAVVQADQKNSDGTVTRLTFTDPDPDDSNMLPPTEWNLGLIGSLYQLQGIRLSSTLLEAFIWGAQTIGAFNTTFTTPFLDTRITFVNQLTSPLTGINEDNDLVMTIQNGRTYVDCLSDDNDCVKMLDISYVDLEGNGTIYATPNKIGVIIEIVSFNISGDNIYFNWPPFPLPPNFIKAIENMAFQHLIPSINSFLENNPLTLPNNIAYLIPNPSLTLVNQPGCCNGNHGYLDFASFCSINNNEQWIECQFSTQQKYTNDKEYTINNGGLYIVQYGNNNCILSPNNGNNYASLLYVKSNNSECETDNNYGLFVIDKINDVYNVGIYCNNSCLMSSCQLVMNNIILGQCYSSIIFYTDETVSLISDPGVVVASFGQSNCKIVNNEQLVYIFTLITNINECDAVEQNISVQIEDDYNLNYKQNCNSSCTDCKVNINNVGSYICLSLDQNNFKWYNEMYLPNIPDDGFLIKFVYDNNTKSINNTTTIVLSTLLSMLFFGLLNMVYLFRKKLKPIINTYPKQLAIAMVIYAKAFLAQSTIIGGKITEKTIYIFDGIVCLFSTSIPQLIKKNIQHVNKLYFKTNKFPIGIETYACLFSLILQGSILFLWKTNDPFIDYVESILTKLQFPNGLICESEKGYYMLGHWSNIVQYGVITTAILSLVLLLLSILYRIKIIIIVSLLLELLFGFAAIHIPPIFFKFQDMINFGTCDPSFFITGNTTMPDFVVNFMEPKIQASFMGLGMASLTNWNLFWLQGLLAGCITACLYFWINNTYGNIKKGFFSIIGIAIPIVISVPLSSIVAIIFLYQGFDVDTTWLAVWLVWWSVSVCMLLIIIVSSYYNIINNNLEIKQTPRSWFILIVYIIVHLLVLIYSLYRELELTATNIYFALGCWLFPVSQMLPLLVLILDYCTDNSFNEYEYTKIDSKENSKDENSNDENNYSNNVIRKILYMIGTIALAVSLFITLHQYIYVPVTADIINFLKEGDQNLEWPKNGTAFDPAIMMYSNARWEQMYFNIAAFIILCIIVIFNYTESYLTDLIFSIKKVLQTRSKNYLIKKSELTQTDKTKIRVKIHFMTKLFGYIAMILMFVGLIMVASPNYLDTMDLEKYLPNCTAEFNHVISQSIKMAIGLICAMIFSAKVSIIAVTFSPAVARSVNILLIGKNSDQGNYTLLWMWLSSSLFGSIMTILPIIFIMQTIGDNTILMLIIIFWTVPFIICMFVCIIKLNFSYKNYSAIIMILLWSSSYIGPIIGLILYSARQYNLWSYVIELLWDVSFWASLIAEFSLSLAIPSDFIESCISICKYLENFTFNPSTKNINTVKTYGTINNSDASTDVR